MGELVVADLHAWYGSVEAVRGVSIRAGDSECVGILGPNGAGKTTLFRSISRLVPFVGDVQLDGKPVRGQPEDVVRQGIAHVLEGRHIFSELTVKENLLLGKFGSSTNNFASRLEAVLEFFPILIPILGRRGGQLSGGQQQILAIARGLLTAPKVLLLDEPSLGLAPVIIEQLAKTIPSLQREWHTTVILSEQFVQLVLAVADRVYVLHRGSVTFEGPADESVLGDAVLAGYLGEAERT